MATARTALGAAFYFALAVFFGGIFHTRYWRWRHEIAESASSYLAPDGANRTAAGILWAVPALLFFGLGLRRGYHYRNPPRTKSDPIGRQRPMNPFA